MFFFSAQSFATDRFVDASLSEGNGTTLFTNVSAAVEAAEDGDRIVMLPDVYPEPTIVVEKSLTFIPSDEISQVTINANFTIVADAERDVKFYNIAFGAYNVTIGNDAGGFNLLFMECQMNRVIVESNSSSSNRSECHIIDCQINDDFVCERDGWDVKLIRSRVNDRVYLRHGDVVQCEISWIYYQDESGSNDDGDARNSIIQNDINKLIYNNDNLPVLVANNSIRTFQFNYWTTNTDVPQFIVNNEFTRSDVWGDGGWIYIAHNAPIYNIVFANNDLSYQSQSFGRGNWGSGEYGCCEGYNSPPSFNFNNQGFFDFLYNGKQWDTGFPSAGNNLVLNEVAGPDDPIDGGSPEHRFYDLDLTVNDRGRSGGTWGFDNFPEEGSGKAFIYDLQIPTDLYPGQDINLKAKAYHRY